MNAHLDSLPEAVSIPARAVREALTGAPKVVFLDDDPTGTQTVRDLPVLTRWTQGDVTWALEQNTPGFFILTNTRSLDPDAAANRNRDVATACLTAAAELGVDIAFASRSDSTLRGHFPLETDVLAEALADHDHPVDGVLLAPAYIDAGRYTVDGTHLVVIDGEFVPAADTEFASDATFGYANSRLDQWVEEKSHGRISAASVMQIPLSLIRRETTSELASRLSAARNGQVIVVDAVTDDDLRAIALAVLAAEKAGATLVYRIGPSFVRARTGQESAARVDSDVLRRLAKPGHGLVVVGSHVGLTTRQLTELTRSSKCLSVELDVDTIIDETSSADHIRDVSEAAVAALQHNTVVLSTSRTLRKGAGDRSSLEIARAVSAAVTATFRAITASFTPRFVVAKGGITSSDVATDGLGITRAWVRGPVLDGIVSLWEPADKLNLPLYVVFPGNVGDVTALAEVVQRLEST